MTGKIKKYAKDKAGFSFVELMVVIALIGVLSAIALPILLGSLSEKRLKNAARNLYADLQKARLLAVKHNTNVSVTFTATGTYSYANGSYTTTVQLVDYGDISYGKGKITTAINWPNSGDTSAVTFKSNGEAEFINTSGAKDQNAGSVYLQNQNKDICYAVTTTRFGAVKIRRCVNSLCE